MAIRKKETKKEPTKQELLSKVFLGKKIINVKEDMSWSTIYLELSDGTWVTIKGTQLSIYWANAEDRIKQLEEKIKREEECLKCLEENKAEVARIKLVSNQG